MSIYDIALTISCFIILSTLFKVVDYFKNKIRELDDEIEKLYILNNIKDSNLKNFEDDIYALMGHNKEIKEWKL